ELLPASALDPARFDRILYQLGNETRHAYMARLVRELGGTGMLHDWVLFDLALRAWPALARRGGEGPLLALREGGLRQTASYLRGWVERRRSRDLEPGEELERLSGPLLAGWHGFEGDGRWTARRGLFRLPAPDAARIVVRLHGVPGRE